VKDLRAAAYFKTVKNMETFYPVTTIRIKSGFAPTLLTKVEAGQTWSGNVNAVGIFTFWIADSTGKLHRAQVAKSDPRIEILK